MEFVEAIKSANIDAVKKFIQEGINLNEYKESKEYEIYDGDYPLNHAVLTGNIELVKILVEAGADVNFHGSIALSSAALIGNIDILDLLIEHGGNINNEEVDECGLEFTPIEAAANNGDLVMVNRLLELGANLERREGDCDYSALEHALEYNHIDIVIRLIEAGENPNYYNDQINGLCDSKTPLQLAIKLEDKEKIDKLIELGADINLLTVVANDDEDSPIIYAINHNVDLEIISYLIDLRADINKIYTYRTYHTSVGYPVKITIDNKQYDLRVRLNSGFIKAIESENIDLIKLFIEKGANVNELVKINTFDYMDIVKININNSYVDGNTDKKIHYESIYLMDYINEHIDNKDIINLLKKSQTNRIKSAKQ